VQAKRLLLPLAWMLLLPLGSQPAARAQQTRSAKAYNVRIRGFKFVPEKLEVNAGDAITWTNEDIVPHIVTGDKFKSRSMDQSESWTYRAKQQGDFPYICRFHPTMQGELIVH
jgi:plastocyanin